MNDDQADKYVESFFATVKEDSDNDGNLRRTLRLLVKEVERDTRHLAYYVVQHALHEIDNLKHP